MIPACSRCTRAIPANPAYFPFKGADVGLPDRTMILCPECLDSYKKRPVETRFLWIKNHLRTKVFIEAMEVRSKRKVAAILEEERLKRIARRPQ